MVTGGYDGSSNLDTTEAFNKDGVWKTLSGRLPTGISSIPAVTFSGFSLIYTSQVV